MNNLKAKVYDLAKVDVGKIKNVLVDLKELINVVNNEVVKETKFNKPRMKVNN